MKKKDTTKMNSKLRLPKGKKFAICLSHDIDRTKKTYQCVFYFFKELFAFNFRRSFGHLFSYFSNPYWNFEKIMNIESKANVRSTFFFLNEQKKFPLSVKDVQLYCGRYSIHSAKIRDVIKKLDKNGWEIGVHGSYKSFQNLNLLKKEKAELEKIVGHPIKGIRQHYLNMDLTKTWGLQHKAGFMYDSSLGRNRGIGFKEDADMIRFPLMSDDSFAVIPVTLMDSAIPPQMIGTKKLWNQICALMDYCEANNRVFVVIWHHRTYSEFDFPGYTRLYEKIIAEGKKRNAHFATLGEVYGFLSARKTKPPKRLSK